MKPARFVYAAPTRLDEAVAILARDPNALVLAGGQSLLPTLNFRLAAPSVLVDLQHIPALRGIDVHDDRIVIRAMVRHREFELDDAVHRRNPLIRETLAHVAHVPIRNRGTVVGSLCHADAAAEMPCLLLLLGGHVVLAGPADRRRVVAAEDFFRFHMTTARAPDEIALEAHFPTLSPTSGWAFQEVTRRHGDYALAGVGTLITLDAQGTCSDVRLAACGIAARPTRLHKAEARLKGTRLDRAAIAAAAAAARDHVETADDINATADLRRQLLAALVGRTVRAAIARLPGRS